MSIFWFIIVGLIAGWIASQLAYGRGLGLIGNLAVGIIGAVIGGYIFQYFGIGTNSVIGSIVVAVIGAVILLLVIGLFRRTP